MKDLSEFKNIFLCLKPVDFRKSVSGLSVFSEYEFKIQFSCDDLFVFFNKDYKKIKILYWDQTGFALWYKSLTQDRFPLRKYKSMDHKNITPSHLKMLLSGIDIFNLKIHDLIDFKKVS
jgi:transposase